jgi:hypothetical protein
MLGRFLTGTGQRKGSISFHYINLILLFVFQFYQGDSRMNPAVNDDNHKTALKAER